MVFDKIKQRSVEKEIAEQLRLAIINGRLALGAHLPEVELAEQMAVSRIPVREALRQLEQEGLVVRHTNRGCFVVDFNEQDVEEVFSLRASLESMAFQWAVPRLTDEDLEGLRRLVQQQAAAIRERNHDALALLDLRFHETLCAKANHSRLLKAWYEQQAQCQILLNLRFKTLADTTAESVLDDHQRILQALERKDTQAAIDLTEAIRRRVSQECKETLRNHKNRRL